MRDFIADRLPLSQVCGLIQLVRPKQWVKNGFVLAPLVFSGEFLHAQAIYQAMLATALFCIASSAAYVVNDIRDVERDRLHPRKSRTRPLATGAVSIPGALLLLALLYGGLVWGWFAASKIMAVIIVYLVLNLAYSFGLKRQPVLDIFIVAIGFVLRVYAGAVALTVPVSEWMFITTLCLALYLASIKRRQELKHRQNPDSREVLDKYSVSLVDRYAQMAATSALIFYGMFVMSVRPQLSLTVPLVLFGLWRYWYVVEQRDGGESPTDALFADWQLLLTVALWVAACIWSLWPVQG